MRRLLLSGVFTLVGCAQGAKPEPPAPDLGFGDDCLVVQYGEWTPVRTRRLPWPDTIRLSRARYVPSREWKERDDVRRNAFQIIARDSAGTLVIGHWTVDGPGYMVGLNIGSGLDRIAILASTTEHGLVGHALHADDIGEPAGVWEAAGKPQLGTVVRAASVELRRTSCW